MVVPSDVELLILEQLREMRLELRAELNTIRGDLRSAMIEVGALKAKVAAIAGIAGIAAAGFMQWLGHVFF